MAEGDSSNGSRYRSDNGDDGGIIRRLIALITGRNHEPTLREQLEEKIIEHEEDAAEDGANDASGDLTATERTMLRNLLHFSDHRVDDVMVPRSEIIALPENASFEDCIEAFTKHGHSRLPVYRDTLDHVVGMVHIRDVFRVFADDSEDFESLEKLMRQPRFVPQNMGVMALLEEMRRTRTHLAIVLDEYSGTEGIVTIEDLVEEIVGDIEDEHDDEPEILFSEVAPGIWEADARTELDDMAEAVGDPKLAEIDEDVGTLGGLAFVIAGQVPQPGEQLIHSESGWKIEILEGDERRVTRVRLHMPEVVGEAAG